MPERRPRLEGKVAIVTGAGSSGPGIGNGKATSLLFAREGAKVVLADAGIVKSRGDPGNDTRGGRRRHCCAGGRYKCRRMPEHG